MNKYIAAAILAASVSIFAASAQQPIDNPMTQAMFDVYNQELITNPKNADIYFRRANEYYKFNQYLRALADIDKAIKYAPQSNRELRFDSYMLRAEIYQMMGRHTEALADFTEATKLDPSSFMALYQKANEEYELGNYAAAKIDFNRLKAQNPRSAEALTGLARVAVKENNLGLASEYMDGAVEMMSADSDIYVRRASVRRMQNNLTGAVEDLLMSISLNNNPRAFQELIDLANEDYPAVISGLSTSISYAPQQGMLYYIRAFIAQAHDHYATALADYEKLINQKMYEYAGLYNSMAQCRLALCKYPEGLKNIEEAIAMDPRNGEFYYTKARLYFAQKRYAEAQQALRDADARGYSSVASHELEGLIDYVSGEYDKASDLYASMIIDQPDVMKHYIMRAWVLYDGMKQHANAQNLYNRVVNLTASELPEKESADGTPASVAGKVSAMTAIQTYRGFGLLYSGNKKAAVEWADNLRRDYRDTDGYLNYMASCLYANAGDSEKALDALEKALQLGYGNLYELSTAKFGRISLAPLRSDARFTSLLARYAHLFEN